MGYYIGHKIAESYYNCHADKKKALVDIIEMQDANNFLKESRYNGGQ